MLNPLKRQNCMRTLIFLFLTISLVTFTPLSSYSLNQNSVEGDRQALVDLYNATNGDNWNNNTGWLNGNPSNSWYGVEVDGNGRVIKLDLYNNNLEGSLPASIGNLSKLRFLSLKNNSGIYTEIPASIANWVNAEVLLFANDQLNTPFNEPPGPPVYNHHWGKNYNASRSKYTGTIPDVFDQMPNLRILQIGWQQHLDEAPFPSTLYQHNTLEILELQGTRRTGTLSDTFNLPELRILFLGNNEFEGSLPSSLSNSTKMVNLKIENSDTFDSINKLSGGIPESYTNFTEIRYFYVHGQNLSGEVPAFMIDAWVDLREIALRNNNFHGEIPSEFGDKNMIVFKMGHNNFSGELHPNIAAGMQNVIIFNVRHNNLSGNFPNGQMVNGEWKGWRTKTRLRSFVIDHNNFTGPLPDMPEFVGDMSLWVGHVNNFTGGIPNTWEELFTPALRNVNTSRTFDNLQLRGNELQGVLPSWFTNENFDGSGIDLKGNRWTHRDILEHGVNVSVGENHDAPQLHFGHHEEIYIGKGEKFMFDYSARVHRTDKVQWTKNGSPISGSENGILVIEPVSESDAGSYRLELTNSGSGLPATVVSEPIELRVGESSGTAPSVPQLSSPSNGSSNISLSPTLSWNSADGASGYRVQVSAGSGFTSTVFDESGISSTQRTVSGLNYDTAYYWRVRAVNSSGSSSWSQVWSFTTLSDDAGTVPSAPQLSTPSNGSTGISLSPTLGWNSADGASGYRVQVSAGSGFTSTVFDESGISSTQRTVSGLNHESTYYWRVRAVNSNGISSWSSSRSFTTESSGSDGGGSGGDEGDGSGDDGGSDDGDGEDDKGNNGKGPGKFTPASGEKNVGKKTKFEWESVEDAESYTLEVTSAETSETYLIEEITDTTYTIEQDLRPNTSYTWRVRAVRNGQATDWSDPWDFTTAPDEETEFEIETELSQNYPNPFNPTTQIRFTIAEAQQVSLKVYDMAGRLVANLVDNTGYSTGSHEITFNANSLASGIYFYRFITEREIVTRKMTLMK